MLWCHHRIWTPGKHIAQGCRDQAHDPVLEAAKGLEEGGIPHIHYHRKCRSLFTMKKSLDSNPCQGVKIESASVDPGRGASRDAPSTSRVYAKVCLFCEKSSKYMKAEKTREPLIQCVELRADEKIRRAQQGNSTRESLVYLAETLLLQRVTTTSRATNSSQKMIPQRPPGECECQTPSKRAQRLATSFGSDLVFAVTSGKTKPPKHVLLSNAVKFDRKHRTDPNSESSWPLVNGIAVQFQVAGSVPENVLPEITKSKIRSITLTASILPIYNVGRRAGPPRMGTAYVDNYQRGPGFKDQKTISGFLFECQTMRTSPSAVGGGFNIKIRRDIAVVQDTGTFQELMESESCTHILKLFQVYLETLRENTTSPAFWMSYLGMVEIMLDLVRASREGTGCFTPGAIRQMIPWCFAMTRSVARKPFGRISCGPTIEETIKKDTPTPGGTKGFSLKGGAVARIGEDAYQAFKEERLETDTPTIQFHDTMTKTKLRTFTNIRMKPRSQGHAKEAILKADRNLFGQMILVSENRKLKMSDVLAHPPGAFAMGTCQR
ncbi:hypothetical protein GWK47_040369 [Chionoecetes opilio]|uniref:Uncharacterized protein n=1 Tax=Chionoecetes opilio TaxID=41210 RepID=A0A8J4YQA2_CHIOP|nr:hypothetical protein GWK47_040369 [Chionoecetes opilio]